MEKKLIVKRLKIGASVLACMAIAASVMNVASSDDSPMTNLADHGKMHAEIGTTYEQPTIPAITLASTVTNTPITVDGSAPTALATTMATVGTENAATPPVVCRHFDYCVPMTFGLHPTDQQ